MDGSFLDVAREVLGRPAFLTDGETVFWSTAYGPARLDDSNVSALLDLFEQMDGPAARKLWLDLYDAASRTEGFIPRVTSHCTQGLGSSRSQPCGARDQEPRCPQPHHFDGKAG